MAATALNASEVKISEEESMRLSNAMCNVAQFYNIAPSEKTQAWMALIAVASMTYYPRFILIRERIKFDSQKTQEAQGAA